MVFSKLVEDLFLLSDQTSASGRDVDLVFLFQVGDCSTDFVDFLTAPVTFLRVVNISMLLVKEGLKGII